MKQEKLSEQNHPPARLLAERLRGILLPFVTPFDRAGEVNVAGIRSNIAKWNKTGITGYVALGSTGERVHLDEREYFKVVEVARAEVACEKMGLIVGAGQQSTLGTINEIKKVAAAGADAVLVITPHYYRTAITQDALVNHYSATADASPVPVILYSMPALTGIKIEPETVARLGEHKNIIGVKDSSTDIKDFRQTVKLCPPDFSVLTGNGTVLNEALIAGASGAILAVGCVVPEMCVEIFRAFNSGDAGRAADLQDKLTPLASAVTTIHGIGGLKAALDIVGLTGGDVRAPLRMPDKKAHAEIEQLLRDALASMNTSHEALPLVQPAHRA